MEPVGIDDASLFLARFANGSLATFEATRYARGHKALYTLEINGEHASIVWDLHDLHRLQYFDHRDEGRLRGWRSIHITDGDHPYMKHWWVPGLQIGYEHTFIHQVADFLSAAGEGKARRRPSARRCHRLRHGRGAGIRGQSKLGQSGRRGGKMNFRKRVKQLNGLAAGGNVGNGRRRHSRTADRTARRARSGARGRTGGSADRGDGLSADLRRQDAERLGRRCKVLARGERRHRRPDAPPTSSPTRTPS